jgi:hypothetical protein
MSQDGRSPEWFLGVACGIGAVSLLMFGLLVTMPYIADRPVSSNVLTLGASGIVAAAIVTVVILLAVSLRPG